MALGINPSGMKTPFGAFSHAAWAPAGRTLHIAGQVGEDSDGKVVGEGDIGAQTEQALRNIGTVLRSAGGTFDDIVSVTVFVTDMRGLAKIHEVRRDFFKPPYPASTLVEVKSLVDPRLIIEIKAVAVIAT
ncbi:MAG: RidA family protein [Candidatus Binataceae bacterium]